MFFEFFALTQLYYADMARQGRKRRAGKRRVKHERQRETARKRAAHHVPYALLQFSRLHEARRGIPPANRASVRDHPDQRRLHRWLRRTV